MFPSIDLSEAVWPRRAAALPGFVTLRTFGIDDPDRAAVERFIREVFRRRHGATVRSFAPTLVAVRNPQGELVAAAGYRCAAEGPLFLERYLGAPVEALLGDGSALPVARRRIAEVGHLVATESGQGRRLIMALGAHLALRRYQWVVATLTEELRHLFKRLGIDALPLAPAHPDALGPEAADWGRYYEHHPMVFAGRVDVSRRA